MLPGATATSSPCWTQPLPPRGAARALVLVGAAGAATATDPHEGNKRMTRTRWIPLVTVAVTVAIGIGAASANPGHRWREKRFHSRVERRRNHADARNEE